jgi:DNA polymerase-3 subunit delta
MPKAPSAPSPLYLIHGNEEFLVDQHAREVLKQLCPSAEADGVLTTLRGDVDTVDAALEIIKRTLTEIQSFSMFGDKNVTWLRDVKFLTGKVYTSADVKDAVERLLGVLEKGLGPEQILVISVGGKLTATSKVLKRFQALGGVAEFSKADKPWEAAKEDVAALRERLVAKGIQADSAVMEAFADRLGGDARMMVQEVEKVDVYLGERRRLTLEDLDLMVSPMREIAAYTFGDAVARRQLARAMYLLKQMETQKVSPIMLIAQLHNQFREMALYRSLIAKGLARLERKGSYGGKFAVSDASVNAIIAEVNGNRKPSPYRMAQLAECAMAFSVGQLDQMARMTAEAYQRQFQSSLSGFLQIEILLLRLLTPSMKAVS